jgi:hypothetical protein
MTGRTKAQMAQDQARIAELLCARTQAEPILPNKELLRLLAWPSEALRTLERDVKAVRRQFRVARRHVENFDGAKIGHEERSYVMEKLEQILAALDTLARRMDSLERVGADFASKMDSVTARADAMPLPDHRTTH